MENRCVICWEIIPEGSIVCQRCEARIMREGGNDEHSGICEAADPGNQKQRDPTERSRLGVRSALRQLAVYLRSKRAGMHHRLPKGRKQQGNGSEIPERKEKLPGDQGQ